MALIGKIFDTLYDPATALYPFGCDDFGRLAAPGRYDDLDLLRDADYVNDKSKFQFVVDVQHFSPEEVNVKHVGNSVVVEAEHKEKHDEHGLVYRHFVRKCQIPPDVNAEELKSTLTRDGLLVITAPKKQAALPVNERVIPIQKVNNPPVNN